MRFAKRLDLVPPYLFAELERKIDEKRRGGVDVISLGIGDPDLPTPEPVVRALQAAVSDPLTHQQAMRLVESFLRFPVMQVTTGVMLAAMATRERFGISYWDAAILEAARSLGCQLVLSEDLAHGRDYAGVRVENPFV